MAQHFSKVYDPGAQVFGEGEPGDFMYVVQSGVVELRRTINGVVRPIATMRQGDFLGEMALLLGSPRTATAVIVERAQLLAVDSSTFEAMLRDRAEIAVRMIRSFATRLAKANRQIELLLNPSASHRVAQYLRQLAEESQSGDGNAVFVACDTASIAAAVGLDGRTVEDAMRLLGDAGLVVPASLDERDGVLIPEMMLL